MHNDYKVITVTATTDAEGIAQNKVVATGIEIASASGFVQLGSSDHTDLVDARLHTKSGIDLMVEAADDSRSIYMHIINRGSTATFAATDDVKVKIGLIQ